MQFAELLNAIVKNNLIKEQQSTIVPPKKTYMRHFIANISFSVPENEFNMICGNDVENELTYNLLRKYVHIAVDELLFEIQDKLSHENIKN